MARWFLLILVLPVLACQQPAPPAPPVVAVVAEAPESVHLLLGVPSRSDSAKQPDPLDYLMNKEEFALSYNNTRGTPNWVSYRLRRQDMGSARRPITFYPDENLPAGFYRVKPSDYHFGATGMSRGHLCPSNHRNNTEEAARATFVMTNMVPQTEELNAGSWNHLEQWCRDACFDGGKELFIICGPHGQGGRSDKGMIQTVGNGRVIVPESCWKVILVLDARGPTDPLQRLNARTRLIAVHMPNTREPGRDVPWTRYAVSAGEVERLTGYRFFDRVPAQVLEPLKNKVDSSERIR